MIIKLILKVYNIIIIKINKIRDEGIEPPYSSLLNSPALTDSIVPEFRLIMIAYIFDQSWVLEIEKIEKVYSFWYSCKVKWRSRKIFEKQLSSFHSYSHH